MSGISSRSHRDREHHRERHGKLVRVREGRVVAGVATGLARRVGWDPNIVRLVLLAMTVAGGSGILAYVAAWLFLPWEDGEGGTLAQAAVRDQKSLVAGGATGLSVLAALLVLSGFGLFANGLAWPVAITVAGVVVIRRTATDPDDRAAADRLMSRVPELPEWRAGRMGVLRILAGGLLVVAGVGLLVAADGAVEAFRKGLLAAIGIVGGVALIFGPWWYRLATALTEERRERIRTQERADVAAHLHDSVLQTLALIQRRADDPRAVTSLARTQERELRAWLFESSPGGVAGARVDPSLDTFAVAVQRAAHGVEDAHEISIDVVTVGDTLAGDGLDDALMATVAAAREAMVNAAKFSGEAAISVYAEIEPVLVSVYVRDRGKGFDPSVVPSDRKGITDSILKRMERHGGKAVVRSAPGEGAEVELRLPRSANP